MTTTYAVIFFVLLVLNYRDEVKAEIAALFFWINFLNCFVEIGGINFYLINMAPPAIVILFCLQHSKRNWSLLTSIIMTLCIFINFLGMINASYFDLTKGYYLYERAIMLTTLAEIGVLLVMPSRFLDGYFTDSMRRNREYIARLLSSRINHDSRLARV